MAGVGKLLGTLTDAIPSTLMLQVRERLFSSKRWVRVNDYWYLGPRKKVRGASFCLPTDQNCAREFMRRFKTSHAFRCAVEPFVAVLYCVTGDHAVGLAPKSEDEFAVMDDSR